MVNERLDAKAPPLAVRVIALAEARTLWEKNPALRGAPLDQDLGPNSVILAPATAWPAGMDAQISLKVGAASKEGPRLSTKESYARFDVVPPFRVLGLTCDEMVNPRITGARCPAKSAVRLSFSTEMERTSYRAAKIQIDGLPLEDHDDTWLSVPATVGRTYTISVGGGLLDIYGQPLIGGRTLAFTTTRERFDPSFEAPTGLLVLDPRYEIPQWVVSTQAIDSMRIQLYQVEPKDYFAYSEYELGHRATPPGKRMLDKVYVVGPRHGANLRVDLRPALGTATGHVIAVATIASSGPHRLDRASARAVAWIQVTRLALSARLDGERINAWVQDITPTKLLEPIASAATTILVEG
nr:hypothetical protein [Deltaproteobacteria bacterium]